MSEPVVPESIVPEPEPPKKRTRSKLIDPLVSSVPTLIGVLVGAVTSHVAEVQRVDFEREDRFRREQIERVAAVAHGYDSLAIPLNSVISSIDTGRVQLCRLMPLAVQAENTLRSRGKLDGRLFSPGSVDITDTAHYGGEIEALTSATDPGEKASTDILKAMIGLYVQMLTDVDAKYTQFAQKREAFHATLMFEVKVYFPDRIRNDVGQTIDGYYTIAKQAASVKAPNELCTLDTQALKARLALLTVSGMKEMTSFAQTLEPELGDEKIGTKS